MSPLIISTIGENIIYPDYGMQTLRFNTGEKVFFGCPNKEVASHKTDLVLATCLSADTFQINSTSYKWRDIKCTSKPKATGRYTGKKCTGGMEAEIGFPFKNGLFVRQIGLCFDKDKQDTLYTEYNVISTIAGAYSKTPRPLFEEDSGFYNIGKQTVNDLYIRKAQRQTINDLLGLTANSTKYIQDGMLFFLSRGHLAARRDFFYPFEMDASFKYINAAPQWQTFNGGNWLAVETDTRNYADKNNVTLKVWTGTFGTATLSHNATGEDTELYLYVHNRESGIRLPALFWKLVMNPKTNHGVVLLGLNNPYELEVKKNLICTDISSQIKWLTWKPKDIQKGYSYACSVPEFRKAVLFAPDVKVSGLLD